MMNRAESIDQYKQYHIENDDYNGVSLQQQLPHIISLIEDTQSKTLLDYGCGKGLQYSDGNFAKALGSMPSLYDPAVPSHDILPDGPFDGIFCTDVFEHIPEEVIPEVINNITRRADKFVFLGICVVPALAILPNGDNAHCTLKPIDWWVDIYNKHAYKKVYTHIKTYGGGVSGYGYEVLNEDEYMNIFMQNLDNR